MANCEGLAWDPGGDWNAGQHKVNGESNISHFTHKATKFPNLEVYTCHVGIFDI